MTKGGDEGQNLGRKDECSGTKDLLNSCKLNLLKDSKTSGEDLTGKLINSQHEIFTKKIINQKFMIFLTLNQKLSTVFRLVYFLRPFVLRLLSKKC